MDRGQPELPSGAGGLMADDDLAYIDVGDAAGFNVVSKGQGFGAGIQGRIKRRR